MQRFLLAGCRRGAPVSLMSGLPSPLACMSSLVGHTSPSVSRLRAGWPGERMGFAGPASRAVGLQAQPRGQGSPSPALSSAPCCCRAWRLLHSSPSRQGTREAWPELGWALETGPAHLSPPRAAFFKDRRAALHRSLRRPRELGCRPGVMFCPQPAADLGVAWGRSLHP